MGLFSRIFGSPQSEEPTTGSAYAAGVVGVRDEPGDPVHASTLVFSPTKLWRNDPVFISRIQWYLEGLLHDNDKPLTDADVAIRDRIRKKGIADKRPRAYHLSDDFAPGIPLYAVDVSIPDELYDDGLDWNDHNHLVRVRYDLTDEKPRASLIREVPDADEVARARIESLFERGARFVWAELTQANYRLYEEGDDNAPCMVMFSFDRKVRPEEMRDWVRQLHPLKFTNPADPVLRDAVWPLEADDQAWSYHRRFTLPLAYTGGRTVYLADLWAHRPFIDGRFRKRDEIGDRLRRIPLLAEKNNSGWNGIELIPFDEADDFQRRVTRRDAE